VLKGALPNIAVTEYYKITHKVLDYKVWMLTRTLTCDLANNLKKSHNLV